jgi:hypothetical protein
LRGGDERVSVAVLLLGLGAALTAVVVTPASAGLIRRATAGSSRTIAAVPVETRSKNWGGYAITAGATGPSLAFTDVTGQWVQPTAICRAGAPTSIAFLVGLGGFAASSTAEEEVGTDADCGRTGVASYFAWYELVPATAVFLPLAIAPGDVITSSVVVTGSNVLVQVIDRTRGTRSTTRLHAASPDLTSAEWLAEIPNSCDSAGNCQPRQETRFGSIAFTRTFATAATMAGAVAGQPFSGTITSANWTPQVIDLEPPGQPTIDPTALTPNGSGFLLPQGQ